jgi:hypothetical protein
MEDEEATRLFPISMPRDLEAIKLDIERIKKSNPTNYSTLDSYKKLIEELLDTPFSLSLENFKREASFRE